MNAIVVYKDISIAIEWMLLWCIETDIRTLSLKMILKQRSWSRLIFLFKGQEWNIQIIEE